MKTPDAGPALVMSEDGEPLIATQDLAAFFDVPHDWVLKRCHMEVAEVRQTRKGSRLMLSFRGVSRVLGGTRRLTGSEDRLEALIRYIDAQADLVEAHRRDRVRTVHAEWLDTWQPAGVRQ